MTILDVENTYIYSCMNAPVVWDVEVGVDPAKRKRGLLVIARQQEREREKERMKERTKEGRKEGKKGRTNTHLSNEKILVV